MMKIGGMQTLTLIDYPGAVAATIFLLGCNLRCHFCHNPELVLGDEAAEKLNAKEIFDFLQSRREFLEGVCITGGEPTIWRDLPDFIDKIKEMGFKVKLDTNGTNYKMLGDLINQKKIDYVAMDIKAPWDKYEQVVGRKVNIVQIKKSAHLLLSGSVDYEFRSTVLPVLHKKEDLIAMARQIKGAKRYYLQQFKPFAKMVDKEYKNAVSYKSVDLQKIKNQIKQWFEVCQIRENL
ncbi:MAG TPA: anaerobic ribonucleoside-triphosphate reductase activating protein [Candidatus Bipolaricaulota bacterium]|nr:anaerobic ribonucleoside-triphosphate reductase activating protein [Candidatus Bipolaricaulota bacterium]